ncbi:MAG TPA: zinc ribbon domain-containing protein, partial [Pirellulaceae bacterium]
DEAMAARPKHAISRSSSRHCPSCQASIPDEAILCVKCGFDFQSGKRLTTVVSPGHATTTSTPSDPLRWGGPTILWGMMLSLLAAFLGVIVWAVVARL